MSSVYLKKSLPWLGIAALLAVLLWWNPMRQSAHADRISFNEDIRPIFNENCLVCHGGVRQSGEFSLLFESDALEPNKSGKPAIVPGHPDSSEMILRITNLDPEERMPLDHEPLPPAEVEVLEKWIEEGAKWETHWSYVSPERKEPPSPRNRGWVKNGIDRFILARLEKEGVQPSGQADCRTLIRRVSLDLVGLPPTPEDADAFCNDDSNDGYEEVVDRLLASPHFGERWAAMWLDLARYADSKGYEKDGVRTIWKFRDWVIQAFNEDMPFDQFTIEQLAGDLLPNPTEDQLIATAFHRNTMNNDEGGTDDEEFRTAAVIDRVNTTWEVWMGTTMACVQCHSHPYDPFRHEEYFEFFAFLNNTEDRDTPDEFPTLGTYSDSQRVALDELLARIAGLEGTSVPQNAAWDDKKTAVLYSRGLLFAGENDESEGLTVVGKRVGSVGNESYLVHREVDLSGADELSINYSSGGDGGFVEVLLGSLEGRRIARVHLPPTDGWGDLRTVRFPVQPASGTRDVYFRFSKAGEGSLFDIVWFYFHDSITDLSANQRKQLLENRDRVEAIRPVAKTPVMRELPAASARKTHVFNRGNWLEPLEEVTPAMPQTMPPLPIDAPQSRLGMAQWVVSSENPLTARVIVNRFWAELFGAGIVETLEDFGTQGAAPSHPKLLDWLALEFMESHDWSVKSLLKTMVTSAAYRQNSSVAPDVYDADPDNRLLARGPRVRLTAEQVRDQALAASGLLSAKMYGSSVMPYQPDGIWRAPYSSDKWVMSEGEDRYRRGIYTYWRRSAPYPSMVTFDSPSREFCVSRRISTNTPLQALVTLNDPAYFEAARALAEKMKKAEGSQLKGQIRLGFRRALARDPKPEELEVLTSLFEEVYTEYEDRGLEVVDAATAESESAEPESEALTVVANALLNLDEFITKN